MKGILLAGGSGTRLWPLTRAVSKQLLPIYDKPMIYYPLSVLMLAGITEILIICTPEDEPHFRRLLGTGKQLGIELSYCHQHAPNGIAEAFILGAEFIDNSPVCLILGDNFFYGDSLPQLLRKASLLKQGAQLFAYHVSDPRQYGVVSFDSNSVAQTLEEKPAVPKSSYAVPGLYFYDSTVVDYAKDLVPSSRGELEVTDLNRRYLEQSKLKVEVLGRGMAWLDAGTPANLYRASEYVRVVEERQGWKVACLEEIAYRMGYIDSEKLNALAQAQKKSAYGQYLLEIVEREYA